MEQVGARPARWLALVACVLSVVVRVAAAHAQDLAPTSASPQPTPEALSADPLEPGAPKELAGGEPPPVSVSADARPIQPEGGSTDLKYLLQRVEVVGNRRTRTGLIKSFVPLETGAALDVNDPEIEALRYRLLGTGWYDRVDLRLKRGSLPGWVVLVIEVEERSTLVFQQLAAGVGWSVEGVKGRQGDDPRPSRQPEPYVGVAVADTNLLGTGRTLSLEGLAARDQGGLALSFFTPVVRFSRWSLRLRTSLVKGREYFGGDSGVLAAVDCSDVPQDEKCMLTPEVAVVEYWRAGLSVGTARDVGSFTRLSLDWHGDFVRVPPGGMPVAASEKRGDPSDPTSIAPIDFSIEPGSSKVSMLTVGLTYDKRDSAILPSRGTLAAFSGDLGSGLIGSDYSFVRLQASYNHWFSLPWGHTIRTGVFGGALFGYGPFFYKFFVSDLTDLMPSRILGLNLDHRPPPNLLGGAFRDGKGTSIAVMRQEELAARIDVEYTWPLVRGRRKFLKAADAYFLLGFYSLSDANDLRVAIPGYRGAARFPIDMTLDAGVRLDTELGVFQIGIAKLLWLPFR